MKIKLTKGMEAVVCDCHYDLVKDMNWQYHINGYALSHRYEGDVHKIVRMHRVINNTPVGLDTDHINRNKLDNRCDNLRTATRSQNNRNAKLRVNNTSGLRGVTWDKANKKWVAQISFNKKTKKLGRFTSIKDAANAYNNASLKLYGEFHV